MYDDWKYSLGQPACDFMEAFSSHGPKSEELSKEHF